MSNPLTKGNMARIVSMAVLVVLIVTLGLMFYRVLAPFILPLFLAGVLAILMQPLYRYFLRRTENKRYYAATITTSAILAVVVVPTLFGITLGSLQLYTVSVNRLGANSWKETLTSFRTIVDYHELAEWWYELSPTTLPVERRIRELKQKKAQQDAEQGKELQNNGSQADANSPVDQSDNKESNSTSGNDPPDENESTPETSGDGAPDNQLVEYDPDSISETDTNVEETETSPEGINANEDDGFVTDEELAALEAQRKKHIEEEIRRREDEIRTGLQSALFKMAQATITPGTALNTVNVISSLTWTMMGAFTFVIALYYFLADGPELVEKAESLIPVNIDHQRQLAEEFSKAVRAVVAATMFAAGAQGIATSIALWLLGFGHFFVFTIVATIAALIPLAGTWLVWLPCAVWLAWQGSWFWAIVLALYGFCIVGMLDNIIRAYILNSDAKLHPLLAFVSVLGGIQAMGLWGVFIAPIVASCLHALVQIFNSELVDMSQERKSATSPPDESSTETREESVSPESSESVKSEQQAKESPPKNKDKKSQDGKLKS